jgi:hypothetical protein
MGQQMLGPQLPWLQIVLLQAELEILVLFSNAIGIAGITEDMAEHIFGRIIRILISH